MSHERLIAAAVAWNQARREAIRLRAERNGIECARETAFCAAWDAYQRDAGPEPTENNPPTPCWKDWRSGVEDVYRAPQSEWCAPCREREAIQAQLRDAQKRRGALIRTLQHFAGKVERDAVGTGPRAEQGHDV